MVWPVKWLNLRKYSKISAIVRSKYFAWDICRSLIFHNFLHSKLALGQKSNDILNRKEMLYRFHEWSYHKKSSYRLYCHTIPAKFMFRLKYIRYFIFYNNLAIDRCNVFRLHQTLLLKGGAIKLLVNSETL